MALKAGFGTRLSPGRGRETSSGVAPQLLVPGAWASWNQGSGATISQHAATQRRGPAVEGSVDVGGGRGTSGPHWRRVLATLGNNDARTAYAQIVLGAAAPDVLPNVKEQRRNRAIDSLLESGLVEQHAPGRLVAAQTIFRDLLAQQPKRQPQIGTDRFMRLGRIERYPSNLAQRRELLARIADEVMAPGEQLTERQVNERLLSYTDDVVLLRRYMVDFGLLQRTPSGSSYTRHV
ncbi:hypothetical protein StoSoilB19_22090 [Arthrobacter sp. StoSoilB19]|uniref:DUF2087 domain-containing protein n=1 Tax=Arthrobacter sp. StoSoilB19 TaxID=2830994 RepID=UPI001CC4771D|nr:DUF2087 domain-containing protein [Arthrobacter sp. StoSoilB19]BCW54835.1 hypothetical protein StoSoilB19_22090 [Arthrobacter sp. StoSoilB19]